MNCSPTAVGYSEVPVPCHPMPHTGMDAGLLGGMGLVLVVAGLVMRRLVRG